MFYQSYIFSSICLSNKIIIADNLEFIAEIIVNSKYKLKYQTDTMLAPKVYPLEPFRKEKTGASWRTTELFIVSICWKDSRILALPRYV